MKSGEDVVVAKQFFLVFGIPKSGTTFLQRMLDMHPQISCPSEQSFGALTTNLTALLDNYEQEIGLIDRRTGGQGVRSFDHELRNNVLSALITALASSFAGAKPIQGLNENSVLGRLAYYDQILQRPKMVAIFRDPVDTAVSTWRHNHRLAEREPDNADQHLARLRNPANTLDGYVRLFATRYNDVVNAYLAYAAKRPNFVTTTYEALVADKKNELRRLFRFLGGDASANTIRPIVESSSREEMAKGAAYPEFFGVGRGDRDQYSVRDEVRRDVRDQLRDELKRLGYDQCG